MKPYTNLVEVHPQPYNNWDPVDDGALVGMPKGRKYR
jgi:hypothetical protein